MLRVTGCGTLSLSGRRPSGAVNQFRETNQRRRDLSTNGRGTWLDLAAQSRTARNGETGRRKFFEITGLPRRIEQFNKRHANLWRRVWLPESDITRNRNWHAPTESLQAIGLKTTSVKLAIGKQAEAKVDVSLFRCSAWAAKRYIPKCVLRSQDESAREPRC